MKIRNVFGISLLALTALLGACGSKNKDSEKKDEIINIDDNPGDNTGENTGDNPGDNTGGNTGDNTGGNTNPEPENPTKVEGNIAVSKLGGDLEAIYAEWELVTGATGYNVYCKKSSLDSSAYQKIDSELVRVYNSKMRADAVGLEAGSYDMKIVACDANGETQTKTEIKDIIVKAHDRSGFAFSNGTASGAYNDNGTLKSDAIVIYVTPETKDTVKATILIDKTETECVGVQDIITGYKKKTEKRPLCVRFVGNITDPAKLTKGDLYIDTVIAGLTLEGIGEDATINGFGIVMKNSKNVEIRNLGFMNCDSNEGDNIGLQQSNEHIWVHNNDLFYGAPGSDADQAKGDGALDTKKSKYVTHSYNHFWDTGKSHLNGNKESSDVLNYISYHHNWYDHSDSRHPLVRCSSAVHVYNNFYDGVSKYGMISRLGASIFSESNYFLNTRNPQLICNQGTELTAQIASETGGMIKSYGDKYDNCPTAVITQNESATSFDVYKTTTRDEQVPSTVTTLDGGNKYSNFDTDSTMYSYTAQTADDAKATVMKYAGRVNGGNFKIQFNEADNSSYDVNPEISAALKAYNGSTVTVISKTIGATTPVTPTDTTDWTTTVNSDFKSMTISQTDNVPTANGLFYKIVDNIDASKATTIGAIDPIKNNITVSDTGVLNINDNSDDTTEGYYMFDSLVGSKTKITIALSSLISKGNWSVLTLIENNGKNITLRTNSSKLLSYSLDGGTTLLGSSRALGSNETIIIIVDSTTNKTTLEYGGKSVELDGIYNIKGIKFNTAATDSRSFVCNGVIFNTLA